MKYNPKSDSIEVDLNNLLIAGVIIVAIVLVGNRVANGRWM